MWRRWRWRSPERGSSVTLHSRLTRLERAMPAFRQRRAQEAERAAAFARRFPTPFDYWFFVVKMAWASPANISNKADCQFAVSYARLIGAIYFEEGSEALRTQLRELPYYRGHRFSDDQIDQVLAWCRIAWVKGSVHPMTPWHRSNWVEFTDPDLPEEERAAVEEHPRRFRYP